MKELLDQLNRIYVEQLSNFSEICRKIAFALYAVTWGLSYSNQGFRASIYFLVVFLLLTVYLIIDALQYFLTAFRYRKHFFEIIKIYTDGASEENIKILEKKKRSDINDRSYRLLTIKISLLPFTFIILIIGIIESFIIK